MVCGLNEKLEFVATVGDQGQCDGGGQGPGRGDGFGRIVAIAIRIALQKTW